MVWQDFAPMVIGGVLIGMAAALLVGVNGRIAGISGICGAILRRDGGAGGWRLAFLAGFAVPGIYMWLTHYQAAFGIGRAGIIVAGLLTGFGTALGSGCTSGHGVCGNANLSVRSFVATLTFMAMGMLVVFIMRHVLSGGV